MAEARGTLKLMDYVMALPDEADRERVLAAMQDAELPPDPAVLDDVEARFGDGSGGVLIEQFLTWHLAQRGEQSPEVEALLHAAAALKIRLAFIPVETQDGIQYVRFDKLQ